MIRSPGLEPGFALRSTLSASRLTHAVAAALAISSVSLCLIVLVTVLSTRSLMAMPL